MRKWLLWACIPVFNTLNQLSMKWLSGVMKDHPFGMGWLIIAVHSQYFWISLVSEIIGFVAWLAILKNHALGAAFALSSIVYVTVISSSWLVFHEPIQPLKLLGIAVILTGIAVLGTGGERKG